jgi:hypothetical protein
MKRKKKSASETFILKFCLTIDGDNSYFYLQFAHLQQQQMITTTSQ